MHYRVFRVPDPDASAADGVYLGTFPDFDAALVARDDDAVRVLAAEDDGSRVLVCHRIVGPDDGAHEREYPVLSELERPVDPGDAQRGLAETRRWLAQIRSTTAR
jgi:hypothetical protein